MKKNPVVRGLMIAGLWLVMSGFALAVSYVKASDSRIEYLGTWKTAPDNEDARYSIYPGSTIRLKVEGTAWLDFKHYNSYDAPHIRVRQLGLNGGTIYTVNNSIRLDAYNGPVEYEIIFISIQGVAFAPNQTAYRDTSMYFKGLWLKTNSVLHHATIPDGDIRVDFLGDSITHGVRILKNYGDNVRSQDASQCFGYYLARALHAPYRVRGHSGESTGGLTGKVSFFKKYIPLDPIPDPKYFFINIGANDKSRSDSWYQSELETIINRVHRDYPTTSIYVLDFFSQHPSRVSRIKAAVARSGSGHAAYFDAHKYIHRFTDGIHPDGASHYALAKALAAKIGPAPEIESPVTNAIVSKRPVLKWEDVEIAESYKLVIRRNDAAYDTRTIGAVTNWSPAVDMPSGDYNWWLQARNSFADFRWSEKGSFKILPYKPTDKAVPVSPSGTINPVRKPKLQWDAVDRATDYYVLIFRNGKAYINEWSKTNMYVPEKDLPGGHYKWWIRPYNADGYGPWSDAMEFDITNQVPGRIVLLSPMGNKTASPTNYEWQADSAATWYKLLVQRDGKTYKKNLWFYTGVTNGVISEILGDHSVGKYKWWVQAWGPDGLGPWSSSAAFTYGLPIPVTPAGKLQTVDSHEFKWIGGEGIPWYHLWVNKDNKHYNDKWVQSTNWIFATRLPYGKYKWWVQSWKDKAFGPWSDAGEFSVGEIRPVYPAGDISGAPLEIRWDDIGTRDAEWYQIVINSGKRKFWNKWIKVEDTVDYGGERAVVNLPAFNTTGNYTWWIRAWKSSGMGPWSEGLPFTIYQP